MKKMVLLAGCLVLILVAGCDRLGLRPSPEAAAKAHVEQALAGLAADTSGLTVKVVESGADQAVVQVTGSVAIDTAVRLVRQNRQWVVAPAETPAAEAPAEASAH